MGGRTPSKTKDCHCRRLHGKRSKGAVIYEPGETNQNVRRWVGVVHFWLLNRDLLGNSRVSEEQEKSSGGVMSHGSLTSWAKVKRHPDGQFPPNNNPICARGRPASPETADQKPGRWILLGWKRKKGFFLSAYQKGKAIVAAVRMDHALFLLTRCDYFQF